MGPFYEAALAVHQRKTVSINLFFERDKNSVFFCFPPAWWTDLQRGWMRIECPLMIRLVGGERNVCVALRLISWLRDESLFWAVFNLLDRKKKKLSWGAFRNMPRAGKQHKRQDLLWKFSLLTKLVDCLRGSNLRDFWSETIFFFPLLQSSWLLPPPLDQRRSCIVILQKNVFDISTEVDNLANENKSFERLKGGRGRKKRAERNCKRWSQRDKIKKKRKKRRRRCLLLLFILCVPPPPVSTMMISEAKILREGRGKRMQEKWRDEREG